MLLVLNCNKAALWGLGQEYPELWLSRSNPGPIVVEEEYYDDEVLDQIRDSIAKEAIGIVNSIEEAKDYLDKHRYVPEVLKPLYRKARMILMRSKTIDEVKKSFLNLSEKEKLVRLTPLREKPYVVTIYEIALEIEEKTQKRLELVEWFSLCLNQIKETLNPVVPETLEDIGISLAGI